MVPSDGKIAFEHSKTLFIQPVSSDLKKKGITLVIPVYSLSTLLDQLANEHVKVEHIFDY